MFENIPSTNDQTPSKKILLVEDDNSIRRFIEIILQKEGYLVTSAEDGLAGMKLALESPFDAVVSDALMPNLSGFDLCRILRQNPNYKEIPFIILSGFNDTSEQQHQADAYLLKGNDLKENLTKKLAELLVKIEPVINKTGNLSKDNNSTKICN
jgi:CheY-like chemotaxis protein